MLGMLALATMVLPVMHFILFLVGLYFLIKTPESVVNKILWLIFMMLFVIGGPIVFLVKSQKSACVSE